MQNKGCPEPEAQPCSGAGVQTQALSFGRAAPARGLPGWAAHARAPWQQEGALPAGKLLSLPAARDILPAALPLPHSHGFLSQGWEPGRRRSCFTCAQLLWMPSTVAFLQPCHSEGEFAGPLSSLTLSQGFSLADRAQFWLQVWHLHCWEKCPRRHN